MQQQVYNTAREQQEHSKRYSKFIRYSFNNTKNTKSLHRNKFRRHTGFFSFLREERLFPISHNGIDYYESDCDDIFLSFYHTRNALGFMNSVYVGDGMRICPDGKWIEA